MGKYGYTALLATKMILDGKVASPSDAWDSAVSKVFQSKSSQKKGCPRGAYLGLCESGVVSGVLAGSYCRSKKNKEYAIKALQILRKSPKSQFNEDTLWRHVMAGEEKVPNHQMDVVLTLWNEGYINT